MPASDGYTGTGDPAMKTKRPKHSGFEAPCIGEVHPKGTTIKTNPDGTISLILPETKEIEDSRTTLKKQRGENGTESI